MDFDDLDALARKNTPLPDWIPLCQQSCYLALRSLYHDYYTSGIPRDMAMADKRKIKRTYNNDMDNYIRQLSIYQKYQENIKISDELVIALVKGAKARKQAHELLDLAVECIYRLTGNEAVRNIVRNQNSMFSIRLLNK